MPRTKEAFESMRETTRCKIEKAALALFARKGLSVSVSEIAQEAGVSKGLMYSHYPSKDALITALVRQASTMSAEVIKKIADSDETAVVKIEQISAMMCEMLAMTDNYGINYFMFMVQAGMSGFEMQGALYDERHPNPAETLAQVIIAGQAEGSVPAGDPFQLAIVYWAAVQGLCAYAMSGMTLPLQPEALSRILLLSNPKNCHPERNLHGRSSEGS